MELPAFRYHPDPIGTGSVVASDAVCDCCGLARGYAYASSAYGIEPPETVCPWCIASGRAHEQFDVEFNSVLSDAAYFPEDWDRVPKDAQEEVAFRTPGFNSWQQERWLIHCDDLCAFLGPAGTTELEAYGSAALLESIRRDAELSEAEFPSFLDAADRDGDPVVFVFRCLHCEALLGYADFT